jgi:hypothetical protein
MASERLKGALSTPPFYKSLIFLANSFSSAMLAALPVLRFSIRRRGEFGSGRIL